MEGGALFKVRSEAKDRVLAAFAAIDIRKNEVGGYAYNDANMLVTEIERVLAEQLFEDSTDGMTRLLSTAKNTLTEYKVTSSIKRKDGEKAEIVSQETESAYATTESKGRGRNRHRSNSSDGKKDGDRNEKEMEQQGWILVDKGSKVKHKPDQFTQNSAMHILA